MYCVVPDSIFYDADSLLHKCCDNAVADCPPVKMKCYSHEQLMEWIYNYLGDEAHNEKLVLGDADVEKYKGQREKLLAKGEKKKQLPVEQVKKKRKVEQKGKYFVQKVIMKCKELIRTYLCGSS